MSNMKQVVYAGAFGALVAMQGCGDDAPQEQAAVTSDGTQSLQQAGQEIIQAAEKKLESFDAQATFKQVEKYAQDQGLDTKSMEKEMGNLANMDAHQMSQQAHKVFENLMSRQEIKTTFDEVKGSLAKVFEVITQSQKYTKQEAIEKVKVISAKPSITKDEAVELVHALETMYNTLSDNTYDAEVDTALSQCKPGFQWRNMPCVRVKYDEVSVATIKAKQNLVDQKEEPQVDEKAAAKKPVKKPVVKDIWQVMPITLTKVEKPDQVFEWIAQQIQDSDKVDKPVLMTLCQAVNTLNTGLKKPVAAVKAGKKVPAKEAKKDEAKEEEKAEEAQA